MTKFSEVRRPETPERRARIDAIKADLAAAERAGALDDDWPTQFIVSRAAYERLVRVEAAARMVLAELDIIRADRRGPTYPRLMVHIDTHNDLRKALKDD